MKLINICFPPLFPSLKRRLCPQNSSPGPAGLSLASSAAPRPWNGHLNQAPDLKKKPPTIFKNETYGHCKPLGCFQSRWSRTQARPPHLPQGSGLKSQLTPQRGRGRPAPGSWLSSVLPALPMPGSPLAANSGPDRRNGDRDPGPWWWGGGRRRFPPSFSVYISPR